MITRTRATLVLLLALKPQCVGLLYVSFPCIYDLVYAHLSCRIIQLRSRPRRRRCQTLLPTRKRRTTRRTTNVCPPASYPRRFLTRYLPVRPFLSFASVYQYADGGGCGRARGVACWFWYGSPRPALLQGTLALALSTSPLIVLLLHRLNPFPRRNPSLSLKPPRTKR